MEVVFGGPGRQFDAESACVLLGGAFDGLVGFDEGDEVGVAKEVGGGETDDAASNDAHGFFWLLC